MRLVRALLVTLAALLAAGLLSAPAHAETVPSMIQGRLVTSDSEGIADAVVEVFAAAASDQVLASSTTESDGNYQAFLDVDTETGLDVKIRFTLPDGYVHWHRSASSFDDATTVHVTDANVSNLRTVVARGASISGTVTDAGSGEPVSGVCASAVPVGADPWDSAGAACSDDQGRYSITDLDPGSYEVRFADNEQRRYVTQWYDGATDRAAATTVTLGQDEAVTGIDAALVRGAEIIARLVDAKTGDALADVCAHVYADRSDVFVENGCSDEQGILRIAPLPAGSFTVEIGSGIFEPVWYDGRRTQRRAALVTLLAGASRDLGTITLRRKGVLTGVVTDAKTGQPLKGICVTTGIFDPRSFEDGSETGYRCTDGNGRYEFTTLRAGSYKLQFFDPEGPYEWRWFGGVHRASATEVAVRTGRTTTVDMALRVGAVVTGTAKLAEGAPAAEARVIARNAVTGDIVGLPGDVTSDGTWTVRGLPTSGVTLELDPFEGPYVRQWYSGATSSTTAKVVRVVAGRTYAGLDFRVERAD